MFGRKTKITTTVDQPEQGYDSYDMRLGDEMRGERATMGKSLMDVQRELRIKARYIAAIENADLGAFDSLSFVAGYVRSYARYLDMDPEIVFARFCEESGFAGIKGMKPLDSEAARMASAGGPLGSFGKGKAAAAALGAASSDPFSGASNPFARRATPSFSGLEPGALGSVAVLALLVGGLAYGGWMVLQEVQRVNVAPVEAAPAIVAELDPLEPREAEPVATDADGGWDRAAADEALSRLYRPQVLEAPILTARDAPISTITPGAIGALAPSTPKPESVAAAEPVGSAGPDHAIAALQAAGRADGSPTLSASVDAALLEALGEDEGAVGGPITPQVLAAAPEGVVLIAVRETWVRIRDGDGGTLYERVMQAGETWDVPVDAAAPNLRTGNSGALYMAVGGQTYGPVAPGVQVVSNVALAADAVRDGYAVADLGDDGDLARVVAELTEPAPPPVE